MTVLDLPTYKGQLQGRRRSNEPRPNDANRDGMNRASATAVSSLQSSVSSSPLLLVEAIPIPSSLIEDRTEQQRPRDSTHRNLNTATGVAADDTNVRRVSNRDEVHPVTGVRTTITETEYVNGSRRIVRDDSVPAASSRTMASAAAADRPLPADHQSHYKITVGPADTRNPRRLVPRPSNVLTNAMATEQQNLQQQLHVKEQKLQQQQMQIQRQQLQLQNQQQLR